MNPINDPKMLRLIIDAKRLVIVSEYPYVENHYGRILTDHSDYFTMKEKHGGIVHNVWKNNVHGFKMIEN